MSSPLRRVAAAVLMAWPCAAPFAASQLYKCVDGGRTVYQQQACSVSTQAEAAASAPRGGATSAPRGGAKGSGPRGAAKASEPGADAAVAAARKLKPSSSASAVHATRR